MLHEALRAHASVSRQEAALLPVLYEVRAPELDEPQHTATAVHRKTEARRRKVDILERALPLPPSSR